MQAHLEGCSGLQALYGALPQCEHRPWRADAGTWSYQTDRRPAALLLVVADGSPLGTCDTIFHCAGMNADWRLPDQTSLISEAPEWSDVLRVLLYYDGPQIVVLRHRERQFLGIAIDENDQAVRWLLAELSPLEFEGLLRGGTSIRSVASKDHVLIVDYSYDNRKVGVWEVSI